MKTRVTYTLVVEIEDTKTGVDQEQRAVDMVMDEPTAFIEKDGGNLVVTSERIAE